jgi:conjugal transfer pilus assembly protein TraV
MKAIFKATVLSICVAVLAGCASQMNPIGESKFDCNRRQDAKSPHCRSFRAVDQATDAPLPKSRFDQAFSISEMDRLTGISPDDTRPKAEMSREGVSASPLLPHQVRNDAPLTGQPVREGPIVQRVWIKRHVDGRDVLTENTVVYREIKPTRWAGFPTPAIQAGVGATYPRRPKEETPNATARSNAAQPQQEAPPEFNQPGNSSGATPEPAFNPAVNGSSSLPR